MQAFQSQIQIEGALRGLDGAQIPHELRGGLGNESPAQTEALGVGDAVIALVRGAEPGETVGIFRPVKAAGIHNGPAHGDPVAVHVFRGGVGDDVAAPVEGTAVHRRGEGVVHNQGDPVGVGGFGKLFNVQHRQGGVGDGLPEYRLGVGPEGRLQLRLGAVRGDEGEVDAHALHGDGKEVEGAAVDAGRGHHMIPAAGDVEHRVKVGRLA